MREPAYECCAIPACVFCECSGPAASRPASARPEWDNPPHGTIAHDPALTITRPDDWHLHVRDGAAMASVVPHSAAQFARALIMPNLRPPVTTAAQAAAYRERILAAVPQGIDFEPLMTLYLTDNLAPEEIRAPRRAGVVALKLYPAGATTNSDAGVTDLRKTYRDAGGDAARRPAAAGARRGDRPRHRPVRPRGGVHRAPADAAAPRLPRAEDRDGAHDDARRRRSTCATPTASLAATITAHHLLYNRNAIFTGGIRPHYYCLPVLKRETHRAGAGGGRHQRQPASSSWAPTARRTRRVLKEHALGCAGCYTALSAMELYAEAFDSAGALDKLEGFASFHGADFYGLPRNTGNAHAEAGEPGPLPEKVPFGEAELKPLRGGETLAWKVAA